MLSAGPCLNQPPLLTIPLHFNGVQELRKLVVQCWDGNPEARPSFEDVIVLLEDLLKKMPKHSTHGSNGGGPGDCCSVQ